MIRVCVCAPVKPQHPIDFQERSADLFDLRISNLALELVPPKQLTPSALKAYKAADAFNFSGRGQLALEMNVREDAQGNYVYASGDLEFESRAGSVSLASLRAAKQHLQGVD